MSDLSVAEVDGVVIVSNAETISTMTPDDARKLARALLACAEKAQVFRSRQGDGMPERVTLDEMRNFK